jgi:hypothetical protein
MENKKIAIAVLTRGYDNLESYDSLIARNELIYNHIISKSNFEFDSIIFHEGNIPQDHQEHISSKSKIPLIFKNVKETGNKQAFDDNKNKVNLELCPPTELSSKFTLGYKHMCHFWAIDLFDYLSEYKHVIRIDEDVLLLDMHPKILEDVIESDVKFCVANMCDFLDDADVMIGLETLLNKFYEKNSIKPKVAYNKIYAPNTNFMILNLDYFKNHEIAQRFLLDVENSSGIYSNRWGDATIWGIILYALQDADFYCCNDIQYYHGSHSHVVNEPTKIIIRRRNEL